MATSPTFKSSTLLEVPIEVPLATCVLQAEQLQDCVHSSQLVSCAARDWLVAHGYAMRLSDAMYRLTNTGQEWLTKTWRQVLSCR